MNDPGNKTGNQSRCNSFIREDCECIHRKRFLTPMALSSFFSTLRIAYADIRLDFCLQIEY